MAKISNEIYHSILSFVEASKDAVTIKQIATGTHIDELVIRRAMCKLYQHPDYDFFKVNENSNLYSHYFCVKRSKTLDTVSMLFTGQAKEAARKYKLLTSRLV
jgi:hypothetical protein